MVMRLRRSRSCVSMASWVSETNSAVSMNFRVLWILIVAMTTSIAETIPKPKKILRRRVERGDG